MQKRWSLAKPLSKEIKTKNPDLHPVILQLLWNRGLRERAAMEVFLRPDWARDQHDPWLFSNMQAAVDRIFQSLEKAQAITVHGDYDADGVCGAALIVSTLREIAAQMKFDDQLISFYIPHRERDGYGLSAANMEKFGRERQTKLVIAVDCGISNEEAIELGRRAQIDTIVCDHHSVPENWPKHAILVHPQVPGEPYPFKELCGTAVAFKLASALLERARERGFDFPAGHEKWLLDLVAIATVTDVMPLRDENRVLEYFGLKVLNISRRPGLRQLVAVSGGKFGELDTTSIGFQIGPRLNAAGRLAEAKLAADLLLCQDEALALNLAMQLQQINTQRQRATKEIYERALEQVGEIRDRRLIAVVGDGWPPGLVGLVAGKLANRFHRPVYVITRDRDSFVGSGRGIEGFNVTQALAQAAEYLDKFGGHPQACGFSTSGQERLDKLLSELEAQANIQLKPDDLRPRLQIDSELDLALADWDLLARISELAPFGEGNPEPVFLARAVSVAGFGLVGAKGEHLRLTGRTNNGKIVSMIGFGLGERAAELALGQAISLAFQISANEWKGRRDLQFKILDFKTGNYEN